MITRNTEIDIKSAVEREREALQVNITEAIHKFQNATGIVVATVNVEHLYHGSKVDPGESRVSITYTL